MSGLAFLICKAVSLLIPLVVIAYKKKNAVRNYLTAFFTTL
ncbi:hypothetical protein L291_2873 [Acinetobacter guillouiae MSP4-18]|nr:hypothetical protein L291_2873 [Acinetobacter guillouiae MSP4-18]